MKRREFTKKLGVSAGLLGVSGLYGCARETNTSKSEDREGCQPIFKVTSEVSKQMYDRALAITKSKVRGGDTEGFF